MTSISKTKLAIVLCSMAASAAACSFRIGSNQDSTPPTTNIMGVGSAPADDAGNPAPGRRGLVVFAPSTTHGTLEGLVLDAETQAALSVQVKAEGTCTGSGCTDATSATVCTDPSGNYVFDAYGESDAGDSDGGDDVEDVIAASGQDSVKFTFTPDDSAYAPLVVWFHPTYTTTDSKQYASLPPFYLCRVDAADSDGDGICDSAEALYGTDPQQPDSDFDALSDPAELFGLDGVDLRSYGADAAHRDVFVYIDFYKPLVQEALMDVQAAFDAAPTPNFDGSTGVHLNLLWSGQPIPSTDQVANFIISKKDSMGEEYSDWSQFDGIKLGPKKAADAAGEAPYFPTALTRIAHYALFGERFDSDSWSGLSRGIAGHDFLVTMQNGTRQEMAGTFMHELGHNLGLQHGGDEETNYKPNYLSIMSYAYQFEGLYVDGKDGVLDYSRVAIEGLDEAALCETSGQNPLCKTSGMTPRFPTTADDLAHYGAKFSYTASQSEDPDAHSTRVMGTCNGPLDFNNNGVYDPDPVSVDLDGFGRGPDAENPEYRSTVFNYSWNDWDNINYYGDGGEGGGWIGDVVNAGFGPIRVVGQPQTVAPSNMPKELRYR